MNRGQISYVASAVLLALLLAFFFGYVYGDKVFAADVCPEDGKVESQTDGDLDDIVLPAGTEVCIKGGQTLVNVTADGTKTLAELLGTGQNVSHYTPETPSTTTTTQSPTTTTTFGTTTTSEATTTTSPPATSSTSTVPTTTPTSSPTTTPTTAPPVTTTTPPTETLPFTGPAESFGLAALAGVALSVLGVLVVRSGREMT